MNKVIALERIIIEEDTGPGPMFKNCYTYIAAEPGDAGTIIGKEGNKKIVAFDQTKLVAVVDPERLRTIEN